MSTPHPLLVPPKGQVKKTSQENQGLFLSCCQLCLCCIFTAELMAQGHPGKLPSGLKAELMPICGARCPPLRQQKSSMPGPAMDAVESAGSRRDSTRIRGEFGGRPFRRPWPSTKSSESLRQPGAMSLKPATDSPAHLVMSAMGQQVAKAAIYTLAWNNHSPGRNDRPGDKVL